MAGTPLLVVVHNSIVWKDEDPRRIWAGFNSESLEAAGVAMWLPQTAAMEG